MGITFPHHMRFYMESGAPRVQHKYFNKDAWGLTKGHLYLQTLPHTIEKTALAEVTTTDKRELRALEDFIIYKEKCVERGMDVQKNREVIQKTKDFKKYLKEFSTWDRGAQMDMAFWPLVDAGSE